MWRRLCKATKKCQLDRLKMVNHFRQTKSIHSLTEWQLEDTKIKLKKNWYTEGLRKSEITCQFHHNTHYKYNHRRINIHLLHSLWVNFTNSSNFLSLGVVDRVSEKQLQATENSIEFLRARILVQVMIYRRLRIGRDGQLIWILPNAVV